MEMVLSNGFCEMSLEEQEVVDGGGVGSLFLSTIGIAFSPAVTCLNVGAGLALFGTSISVFCDNM